MKSGIFPEIWKISKITPIFKNGAESSVENSRPVAVLSAPAKVLEMIMHHMILKKIEPFLISEQHGFRVGRSTDTNLMVFTEYVSTALDKGLQVDCSYNDFSKAFDRVDHDILLEKLQLIGLSDGFVRLFSDYFNNTYRMGYT